jgi:hypothetical protein
LVGNVKEHTRGISDETAADGAAYANRRQQEILFSYNVCFLMNYLGGLRSLNTISTEPSIQLDSIKTRQLIKFSFNQ